MIQSKKILKIMKAMSVPGAAIRDVGCVHDGPHAKGAIFNAGAIAEGPFVPLSTNTLQWLIVNGLVEKIPIEGGRSAMYVITDLGRKVPAGEGDGDGK